MSLNRAGLVRGAVSAAVVLTIAVLAGVVGFMLRPAIDSPKADSRPALNGVEVGFLQDMTQHHLQATTMAQMVDREGVDDRVRTIARQIQLSQQNQMGMMTGWLQLTDNPIQNPTPMSWMTKYAGTGQEHDHETGGSHTMPGMATDDEVNSLATLPGAQAATEFLQLMQRHHFGGIAMAQDLVSQVPSGNVSNLARSMIVEQTKETGLMGTMLTERGVAPR